MTDTSTPGVLLDAETASFIQGAVSIMLAAADTHRRPTVTRVYACRVAPERNSVTLFIPATYNTVLLENIRATRSIAVVFTQPTSHKTIQLKGNDAEILPVQAVDHSLINDYFNALAKELSLLGHSENVSRALVVPPEKLDTAIRFTPLTAFSQTPGPQAGKKLSI